ncbi:Uncharacterized protein PCOAH_00025160 [Plasmodium coatneyi]|uniref:Sec16 Sec23-binding domain-containing protein n=1 Tax=Plasmodium coatneyi TaxID=208452 RepID=A0A1B1E029_9APIC|nr:Uncharacterized protein PCOAH_00025160 [Plasmodium coatneyi]ANQ08209.1 Uncharacterized protein PCOAH_00025160 [Plasmodium coatneyi]
MEEHLFSYENIFRNKDLIIDEEIRDKNQKENRPPDEGKKGEMGDTTSGGEGRPIEVDYKGNPVEAVEEASTEVTRMTHVVDVRSEGQDTTVHRNRQIEPQSKKKIKNDISFVLRRDGPRGEPASGNSEINFWFSGKGTTMCGGADGQVGKEDQTHNNNLTTPRGNNPDGATDVKYGRRQDGGNGGIQNGPNGVDDVIGESNEEKQIRGDLRGDVIHLDRCKNGPSEKGEDAPRGGTSKGISWHAVSDNAARDNGAGEAAATALCFGTNGTFCYTRGRKVKFAPLICIMESGIRTTREGSHSGAAPAPSPSHTSANRSNSIEIRDNRLEEHVHGIRNFPGPFSRRTDKIDKKVINFLHGHMKINEKKYGNNLYEYTQKSCLYNYLLNVVKSPHLLDFNLKDVRVVRSGVKSDGGEKRRNVVSYFVESSRQQGNGHQSGRSDYSNCHHDWSGNHRASENNPREKSGNQDDQRRNNPPDVGEKGALNNKRTEMDEFEITGRETEKREFSSGDLYQGDNASWRTSEHCRDVSSFNLGITWSDTNSCEKKKVFVQNEQYQFNDLVDPHFISAFAKMGTKEKITREDIYLEYYHLCIYNSEKAARVCMEKNLFRHFFLVLKKYNREKYRLMLSKYISHIDNSMDHEIEVTDGVKNIFRIYNPSVHSNIVKEAFVFFISLLNRESMTFQKNILVDYWYSFYVLIYHNFLFQFEENELNYQEYRDDIHIFFSFLIKQLFLHGRVTEGQFLYLQLYGNPCVFKVATEGNTTTYMKSFPVETHQLNKQGIEHSLWGGPHFDVLTFQMCEVVEYLNRSNEDNFFYEDLIEQKIRYAFTLLELGVLEQAKKYIEIIYYYVDVIRSQKKNYYLVHLYESLLSRAKYVLPSLRLHSGGIFSTNWTASNEDLPEGGMYNYKVISPHGGVGAHMGNPTQGKNVSREGDSYYVPFYQHINHNNVTMIPFGGKNPSGFNTDRVGSTYEGETTGRTSNPFRSNPASRPHISAPLTTHHNENNEKVVSYSPFSFAPTANNVATKVDQSNIHHDASNSRTSITPVENAPYERNDGNSISSSYHPPEMVASGGAEYTLAEKGITYEQYNGAYQNEAAQVSYFYGGGKPMAEGAVTSNMPDGGNSTTMSFQQINNPCNSGYNANWTGNHSGGSTQYGGMGSTVGQDNFAHYYDANWQAVYQTAGSFNHATDHAVQQASHQTAHQSAYPLSSKNYPSGGAVLYGGNAKPSEQSGNSGPPEVTEKKEQTYQPHGENNMDLINIGKTFISGFFSNIKEKIKMAEQTEEEEEENLFYYDYEKKRWREKGVTSDEEEERERQKMQREMEMKNVAPPPQAENPSNTNKKNPLNITDVRSRYVDYFN